MSKFVLAEYVGVPANVGRFGALNTGDQVSLTHAEASYLERNGDKDFKVIGPTDENLRYAAADIPKEVEEEVEAEDVAKEEPTDQPPTEPEPTPAKRRKKG